MPKTEIPKGKKIIPRITARKKRLIKLIVENRGKPPDGKMLIKAGYSKAYASNPGQIRKTKSWEVLMQTYIPEEDLAIKHKQLLNASNIIDSFIFSLALTDDEIKEVVEQVPGCVFIRTVRNSVNAHAYFYRPDNGTQLKSLELGYKLHKKLGGDEDPNKDLIPHEEIDAFIMWVRKTLPASQ